MCEHSTDAAFCSSTSSTSLDQDPAPTATVLGTSANVGTTVSASRERLTFVVRFRRDADPRDVRLQLVATADEFDRLPTPDGYHLHAIDLLALDREDDPLGGCRRVACMLMRSPNTHSALTHLVITATGALHPVPQAAAGDVLNLSDWRVIYSHHGVTTEQ
jgi:hypothetical protein